MNKCQEVPGRLLVSRRHPPRLLDQVDEPLDLLALFVQVLILITRHLPMLLGRDYCLGTLPLRRLHDGVAVVGLVGDERIRLMPRDQGLSLRDVRLLTGRQDEFDRVPQRIDRDVDLGAESAAGTAEGLVVLPPFFPAAC
jgi:hypothetical protein